MTSIGKCLQAQRYFTALSSSCVHGAVRGSMSLRILAMSSAASWRFQPCQRSPAMSARRSGLRLRKKRQVRVGRRRHPAGGAGCRGRGGQSCAAAARVGMAGADVSRWWVERGGEGFAAGAGFVFAADDGEGVEDVGGVEFAAELEAARESECGGIRRGLRI